MENKEQILTKLKSLWLCMSAHPDNEPDSEFADRISDLEEIIELLQSKEQNTGMSLQECKDEVAKKHEAISELDLIGSLVMSRNPEAIQDYVSEVAELYASQPINSGWVSVEDRLPDITKHYAIIECSDEVQVYSESMSIKQAWLKRFTKSLKYSNFKIGEYIFESSNGKYNDVTHWMPLPLPPKQDKPLTECMMGRDSECNHPRCPVTDEDEENGRFCTLPLHDYRK